MDQFDENENIVHRADEQESASSLTVTDAFTRLVWIDPNSPTLQRKGVTEERTRGTYEEEEDRDEMEAEEKQDEEDAETAYEQDYRAESKGNSSEIDFWADTSFGFKMICRIYSSLDCF